MLTQILVLNEVAKNVTCNFSDLDVDKGVFGIILLHLIQKEKL